LSSTFTKETHLGVELPEANGKPSTDETQQIEIVIGDQGTMSVNGQSLVNAELETLKSALLKVSEGKTDLPLLLTADAKTPHQFVVIAMDAAGQLGFTKMSITSRAPEAAVKSAK
jgi:biopolymer transport protein ExbD